MIRSNAVLEIKRGERVYQFQLSPDSPLGEAHDVLHEMQIFIIETIQERAKKAVKVEDPPLEEKPKEEVS